MEESILGKQKELSDLQQERSRCCSDFRIMQFKMIFLLEGIQLFSLLSSSDLISLSRVHSSLSSLLRVPSIWKTVFDRESAEQIAAATQIPWIKSIYEMLYPRTPDPRFFGWQYMEIGNEESPVPREGVPLGKGSPSICVSYLERPTNPRFVSLDELQLLEKLSESEGWYEDKDGFCHCLRLNHDLNESGIVLYCGIPVLQWNRLVSEVVCLRSR